MVITEEFRVSFVDDENILKIYCSDNHTIP